MAKVGDKYIVEIEEVLERNLPSDGTLPFDPPTRLYRINGFNSLVFDEHGLSKLEQYEEHPYEDPKHPKINLGDEVEVRVHSLETECPKFYVTSITMSGKVRGIDAQGNIYEAFADTLEPTGRRSHALYSFLMPL